jgi:ribosomal protein L39E
MRLTKADIAQHRAALQQWQRPSDMLRHVRALMHTMGNEDLFNQPGVDFITEALAAAQFAKGRRALAVRLVAVRDQWPDFEIRTRRQHVEAWEFTEVDDPKRRRGQETKRMAARRAAGKTAITSVSFDRLFKQAARVPGWIRARCRAKVDKHYPPTAGLLVYLNWGDYGTRHAEIEQSFLTATAIAKDAFTEVWVLWKARLYRTWSGGQAAALTKGAPDTHDAYARR